MLAKLYACTCTNIRVYMFGIIPNFFFFEIVMKVFSLVNSFE